MHIRDTSRTIGWPVESQAEKKLVSAGRRGRSAVELTAAHDRRAMSGRMGSKAAIVAVFYSTVSSW
jgi:hypothetical protein